MSQISKRSKKILTPSQKYDICIKKQTISTPSNKELALEYSVGESTIHDILQQKDKWLVLTPTKIKQSGKWPLLEEALWLWTQGAIGAEMDLNDKILQRKAIQFAETLKIENFKGSLGIPISFQENNTRESIPTITSTISSRESTPIINQENLLTTTSHITNQEGTNTTLQKSSTTTNLENFTTTIQNDIITINQYENIQGLINQLGFTNPMSADDKRISIEEFLDDEMIHRVVREISPSIEEEIEEISLTQALVTQEIENETLSIQIPSTQEVIKSLDDILLFLEHPPENFKVAKTDINSIRNLYKKTKKFQSE
ncbi:17288_t:CDS:2 [Acaulospora morrowiae]|uniref:17288_t:CDS:1 n=1 Tax=Acaulospora morrowiae TaxID=94023 RepID=A0A9N8UZS2_9GLOM|nr:17288_t:CDS:2 [Acaulospora morrowiae]